MSENPQLLPTTSSMVGAYYIRRADGTIEEDTESREIVRRKFEYLIIFLHENGLVMAQIHDKEGSSIDRPYYKNDFTEEGIALVRKKLDPWLNSKASNANPPEMTALERALTEIRSG